MIGAETGTIPKSVKNFHDKNFCQSLKRKITKRAQKSEIPQNLSKKQTNQSWLPKRLKKLKRKTEELVIALSAGKMILI
jgi:uncharacterized protein YaaW (UPF0174 family)